MRKRALFSKLPCIRSSSHLSLSKSPLAYGNCLHGCISRVTTQWDRLLFLTSEWETEPSFLTGTTNSFQDTLIKCGSGLVVDPQHPLTGHATWDLEGNPGSDLIFQVEGQDLREFMLRSMQWPLSQFLKAGLYFLIPRSQ